MEGIDRLHGIQVCTEFNQKAAPHPIVPELLKLEVVSGLANSLAHLLHTTTLWIPSPYLLHHQSPTF